MTLYKPTWKVWFEKAGKDLRLAKELSLSEDFMEISVFHSQQGAEKAIKGYLAFKKVRFTKTHEIEKLLKLVAGVNSVLADSLTPSEILTVYATAYRYPEEVKIPEPMTQEAATKVFVLANWVYEEMAAQCGINK